MTQWYFKYDTMVPNKKMVLNYDTMVPNREIMKNYYDTMVLNYEKLKNLIWHNGTFAFYKLWEGLLSYVSIL